MVLELSVLESLLSLLTGLAGESSISSVGGLSAELVSVVLEVFGFGVTAGGTYLGTGGAEISAGLEVLSVIPLVVVLEPLDGVVVVD